MLQRRLAAAGLLLALAAAAPTLAGCASAEEAAERQTIEVYLHNAQSYVDGGHWDQALDQFRQALSVDPSNQKALLGEATSLCELGLEENPRAGRAIQEAADKIGALRTRDFGDNGWKVDLIRGRIHDRLAALWDRVAANHRAGMERGEPDAEKGLEEALRNRDAREASSREALMAVLAREDQPLARDNLTALLLLGRRQALRASTPEGYDEALRLFRRFEVQVDRSKALWREMKKREPDLAEFYERKLRGAERQEIELRDLMANIHFKRRDHEASIAELEKVIALDPYRASTFLRKGQNEEELGRFGAAADDYRRFLKVTDLPPTSPDVIEATQRMARCEEKVRERMAQ